MQRVSRGVRRRMVSRRAHRCFRWIAAAAAADRAMERAERLAGGRFTRLEHAAAVQALQAAGSIATGVPPPVRGGSLSAEHERWLSESYVRGPVFITHFPRSEKPFYAREDERAEGGGDDIPTVAAVDLLAPVAGELASGSVREERLERLLARMQGMSDPVRQSLAWYVDLRRFGTFPHMGFGLGFERMVQAVAGIANVRDACLFPRYFGSCRS